MPKDTLAEEFAREYGFTSHRGCVVCQSGHGEEIAEIHQAGGSYPAIAEFMTNRGVKMTRTQVARHCRGECK